MKSIIKLIMAPIAAYFGLNWVADNPVKTKYMRNQVDQRVEQGYEFALFQFKSFSSEPAPKPESKPKKQKQKKGD
jgi:hypothetical protein